MFPLTDAMTAMPYLFSSHSEEESACKDRILFADRMTVVAKHGPRTKRIYCCVIAFAAELLQHPLFAERSELCLVPSAVEHQAWDIAHH